MNLLKKLIDNEGARLAARAETAIAAVRKAPTLRSRTFGTMAYQAVAWIPIQKRSKVIVKITYQSLMGNFPEEYGYEPIKMGFEPFLTDWIIIGSIFIIGLGSIGALLLG